MKENRTSCLQTGQADLKAFSVTMQVSDLQIVIYYKAEKELIKGTEGFYFFLWYVFKVCAILALVILSFSVTEKGFLNGLHSL